MRKPILLPLLGASCVALTAQETQAATTPFDPVATGSASRSWTHTGRGGVSRSAWTTVYRSDDGFGRSQGYSDSRGRAGVRSADVVVGDDAVTINRSRQTASGQGRTTSRTFTRRP